MLRFPHAQPLPPDLASGLARAADRLGPFARQAQWYVELSSTNDLAGELAALGAREGLIILADTQTAGRGRLGRTWHSPSGAGLYLSVVLRPQAKVVPLLTIAAGVAVAEGIRSSTGLSTAVKWPNDVLIAGRRKIAGILAEAGSSSGGVSHVIVGIGINVRPAAYPPDVAQRATSLEEELGRPVDRGQVLADCLAAFAARYDDLQRDRTDAVLLTWRKYAKLTLGHPVEWDDRGALRRGIAEDVDGTGALLVRTDSGMTRVISGEVRWI
jgi:BirA family biotin operon repressor/biotin-[acetyl-CoA-carboxylase] ligase